MSFVDRYRSLGLDRNPFSTEAISASDVFVDRGVPPPPPPNSSACILLVGDSGFGKSTHIARWRRQTAGPYHYIPLAPYRERWAAPPRSTTGVVYGDEIDRMPALLRWRWLRALARAHATVVIGTHVDLADVARRAGFRDVRVEVLKPLDHRGVEELVAARISASSLTAESPPLFGPAEIDEIHARSGGVPRRVEVVCHGLLADKAASGAANRAPQR